MLVSKASPATSPTSKAAKEPDSPPKSDKLFEDGADGATADK